VKPDQSNIDLIRSSFAKMVSKEDFLALLNLAKPMIYGEKAIPFQMKQITWYSNPKAGGKRYVVFKIKKKSGADRIINAPVKGLKVLQKTLGFVLSCVFEPHEAAMGFVSRKSIVDNARPHEGSLYVYNIDLKDFFSSIDQARVWKCLQLKPFYLRDTSKNGRSPINQNGRQKIANMIAAICCTELDVERKTETGEWINVKRNVLPQGAPTSPLITNVVCQRLDYLLTGVAKRFGLKYTRYADDITFSSMINVYGEEGDFLKELHRIISEQGFFINEQKTRLQKDGYRKEVTGLLVNSKVNVHKRYIKQLRMWLYYWERYGYDRANNFFLQQYNVEKGHNSSGNPEMINVIQGKLNYLKMVKGKDNATFGILINRFNNLVGKNLKEPLTKAEIPSAKDDIKLQKQQSIKDSSEVELPVLHNPKELVELLKNFSVNNSSLKYTTHNWDSGRDAKKFTDLSGFLKEVASEYNKFSYRLNNLNSNLNGKIYSFLLRENVSDKGWGQHHIKFGWSSPELLKELSNNPKLNPEDFILPAKYQVQIGGKTIQKFKQVIEIFKNEIEIRDENSRLLNLILEKHDKFLPDFSNPQISNLDNKTFYTDVQWFDKALNLIFENIRKRPQHREVKYRLLDNNEDVYVLEILHVGSYNSGKSIKDDKLTLKKGDFGNIYHYLKNLCDWSIESKFTEGYYRINYLISDSNTPLYQEINDAEGFKYLLTFYK